MDDHDVEPHEGLEDIPDEEAPAAADPVAALLELLNHGARRNRFKPPTYDGSTDIELFVRQFNDVRAANNWNRAATLLHLRSCLQDDAIDSGTGATVDEIFTNLRSRFGLTERQARDRLNMLQRTSGQSLQALGLEAERLVTVAYPDIPANVRVPLAIDAFNRALDDRSLKRHLLLAGGNTMSDTVRHAEEYLQIGGKSERRGDSKQLRLASTDLETVDAGAQDPTDRMDQIVQRLDRLTTLMEGQVERSQSYQSRGQTAQSARGRQTRRPGSSGQGQKDKRCFECSGLGHFARDCPSRKSTSPSSATTTTQSGNDQSPRQ